jgi:hypothetical protein
MSDRRVTYLALAGCVFFGAIILVELGATKEEAITEVPAPGNIAAATDREQRARVDEQLATARDRPLFSATRRPPQQAEGDTSTGSELTNARLTGIVIELDRRLAIFAVPEGKPLERAEGEMVSGWHIDSIAPQEVSLSGPTGIKTLRPRFYTNPPAPPGSPRRADSVAAAPTTREVAAEAPPGVATARQPNLSTAPRPAAVRRPMPGVATKPPVPILPRAPAQVGQQRL